MSTYYQYQDVKVMIAHKLMEMDDWKVYGYHKDNSDPMTDYYDPAYWDGVAEKNGYILCVDVYGEGEEQEIKRYTNANFVVDKSIRDKINKLQELTTDRGATEGEAATAQKMIEKMQAKLEEQTEQAKEYVVVGKIPAHMAHPPRMNWHIEKDGVYIAKGNGILKFSSIDKYYRYSHFKESMQEFRTVSREQYKQSMIEYFMEETNTSKDNAETMADSHIKDMEKNSKLIDQFEKFINKIDTTCGGLIGNAPQEKYEKITVTKYKKENKVVEDSDGSIKEGQMFVLKSNFNYGCRKGMVYRIHETEYNGTKMYHAYKLNGKLTKECTGRADSSNYWWIGTIDDSFAKWITKGAIAWCHLEEVSVPYEVEKVVKRTVKTANTDNKQAGNNMFNNYSYTVSEDVDTRTNERIYLVKIADKLSREDYIEVNKYIKSLGGYYSKFKHAFLFKDDPSDKLGK